MVTVHRTPDGRTVAYVKGSPGALLEASRCPGPGRRRPPAHAEDRRRCWRSEPGAGRRGAARPRPGVPGPAGGLPRGRPRPGLGVRRAGRHDRPAPGGGEGRHRDVPRGGHPHRDDHRRPAGDGRRDRRQLGLDRDPQGRPLADRPRPGAGRPGRRRLADGSPPRRPCSPASRPSTSCRSSRPCSRQGRGGGHDRRRGERRPGPEEGGHRHRDGDQGDGGRQGSGRHGHHRRQLRHHRRRRRAGADHLRQHPPLRPLPVLLQLRGDPGRLCRPHDRLAAAAGGPADPVAQHDHRRLPRHGPRPGAVGTRT